MHRDQVDALIALSTPWGPAALTAEELAGALERGRALAPPAATTATSIIEGLLDAEQLASVTGVPASWWSEQARRGEVPVRHFGRYPRFMLSEILACPRFKERTG